MLSRLPSTLSTRLAGTQQAGVQISRWTNRPSGSRPKHSKDSAVTAPSPTSRRQHDLATSPSTPSRTTLMASIATVQKTVPAFRPLYDTAYFEAAA